MEIVTPKNAALMCFIVCLSLFFFLYNVSNYDIGLKKREKKKTQSVACAFLRLTNVHIFHTSLHLQYVI